MNLQMHPHDLKGCRIFDRKKVSADDLNFLRRR